MLGQVLVIRGGYYLQYLLSLQIFGALLARFQYAFNASLRPLRGIQVYSNIQLRPYCLMAAIVCRGTPLVGIQLITRYTLLMRLRVSYTEFKCPNILQVRSSPIAGIHGLELRLNTSFAARVFCLLTFLSELVVSLRAYGSH